MSSAKSSTNRIAQVSNGAMTAGWIGGVVTAAALGQYESGATRPSTQVLAELSRVLDVPAEFFTLSLVETHEGFFRSTRRTSVAYRRHARALAHIAHDLATRDAAAALLPPVSLPELPSQGLDAPREQIEDLAQRVRRKWGVPARPIPNVVGLLESHGIVVLRLPLDTADVDAFSLPFHDRPVVVLATDKNDRARSRFDGAHELGHLVMHGEHVWGLKQVESHAHAFAAAFLMPDRDIRDELPTYADWPALFDLKHRWQVSLAALPPAREEPRPDDRCQLPHRRQSSLRARLAAPGTESHRPPREPRPPTADRRSQPRQRRQQSYAAPHRRRDRRSQPAVTGQPGRWPVRAPSGGPP